jgi:outer membrane phospholipase A
MYKDNYFISGDEQDQIKFQVSAKYALLYPTKLGLYVAYSQTSSWHIYDKSGPFYDNNYQPEAFLLFESKNNIFNLDTGLLDYIQLSPIFHMSNGRDGAESRGINTYYGQVQISYGDKYNVGLNVKAFNYYNKSSKNEDIELYKSYYEACIFFKLRSTSVSYLDKEEISFKFGGYDKSDYDAYQINKDFHDVKGYFIIEAQFRIITSYIQPKLFLQYYSGYGEFMIDYNKRDNAVRAGLVF